MPPSVEPGETVTFWATLAVVTALLIAFVAMSNLDGKRTLLTLAIGLAVFATLMVATAAATARSLRR